VSFAPFAEQGIGNNLTWFCVGAVASILSGWDARTWATKLVLM